MEEKSEFVVGPFSRNKPFGFSEQKWLFDSFCHGEESYVLVDVGAHHDSFFREFALNHWRVFAIEPLPANLELLKSRWKDMGNVSIIEGAVSDSINDSVSFYTSTESSGISSMIPFRKTHEEVCKIQTTTLQQIVKENGIPRIDLLKIDTEGYDLPVLQGLDWEVMHPRVIMCEFENRKSQLVGYEFEDMVAFLKAKGYHLLVSEWHEIKQYGIAHDWLGLRDSGFDKVDSRGWGNIVATQSDEMLFQLKRSAKVYCRAR